MDAYTEYAIATFTAILFIVMPAYVGRMIGTDESEKHPFLGAFSIIGTIIEWLVVFYITLGLVW